MADNDYWMIVRLCFVKKMSTKQQLLLEYRKDVNNLRNYARKQLKLTDLEITTIFDDCYKILNQSNNDSNQTNNNNKYIIINNTCQRYLYNTIKLFTFFTVLLVVIYILLNVHQTTSSIVLRNVQGLIHPGLKILRFLSVPVIKQFPALTGSHKICP